MCRQGPHPLRLLQRGGKGCVERQCTRVAGSTKTEFRQNPLKISPNFAKHKTTFKVFFINKYFLKLPKSRIEKIFFYLFLQNFLVFSWDSFSLFYLFLNFAKFCQNWMAKKKFARGFKFSHFGENFASPATLQCTSWTSPCRRSVWPDFWTPKSAKGVKKRLVKRRK